MPTQHLVGARSRPRALRSVPSRPSHKVVTHFHLAGEEMEAQEVKRLAHGPTARVSDRAGSEPVPRTAPPTQGSSYSAPAPLAPHPQARHPRGPDVAMYHWLGVWFQ